MLTLGTIFNDAATAAGFMAASIAVGGFLAHVQPALAGKDDRRIRSATVIGGVIGFAVAASIVLVALLSR